jgi:NADH:ubiquinone oxidoreductase subunit F (NADH-binding)
MDRSVLESDPHRVLEGMAIAAYAVGASQGYIYVRAEYPLAVQRLKIAIRQAEKLGLSGTGIFGTPLNFRIDIRMGAGAFVCGEETALIASVEGKRGTPRPRPPFPAMSGLWGKPTLINNVETMASIPPIIRKGGAWYATIGTEKSKGTKVFALAGKINNTGLIEVPMGITLREIINDIGGGIPDGRKFKAVQTGGPSGGCIPAEHLDMPLDYDSLAKVGSIMGSGGMIVREVHPLPGGHGADAQSSSQNDRRPRGLRRPGALRGALRSGQKHEPLRPRPDRAQPGEQHPAVFPRRIHGAYREKDLPGRRLPD